MIELACDGFQAHAEVHIREMSAIDDRNMAAELLERFPALKRIALARTQKRIPIVRQMAQTDCGAAALAMALGFHGRISTLEEVRKQIGPGRGGVTANSILQAGRSYGLRCVCRL